ncbi:MAG TPA: zinc-binding dehydrogenase [Ignavibacteria bacterium]|nr:alcohol dehydrogenase [Bacteroidota bacterium]HRI85461.1 zinc-binding dehydrogenase [Ignavibacteria bacterium]HRJ98969.1 zinc-binding dehydrogenase [Ignavibacteria bacterium]
MKAIVLNQTGKQSRYTDLFRVEEVPVPEISQDEVLIKIFNASLNHRDLWIAEGAYSKIRFPVIPGSDGAGIIYDKGKNSNNFSNGDKVLIYPCRNWGSSENFQNRNFEILGMPEDGTFAEYVKVHSSAVFKIPAHLSFAQASAFPLAGLTAFRSLFVKAEIKKTDNVLITGIGGGVASFALMFAAETGAKVFVTSGNEDKIINAVSLGAEGGVNYKSADWQNKLKDITENKIDIVIDGSGGKFFAGYIDICSYGARIVSYGATLGSADKLDLHKVYWKQLKISGSTMGTLTDFSNMLKFSDSNQIKPVIDKVFPFQDYQKAFERMKNSEQFGKIVLEFAK